MCYRIINMQIKIIYKTNKVTQWNQMFGHGVLSNELYLNVFKICKFPVKYSYYKFPIKFTTWATIDELEEIIFRFYIFIKSRLNLFFDISLKIFSGCFLYFIRKLWIQRSKVNVRFKILSLLSKVKPLGVTHFA